MRTIDEIIVHCSDSDLVAHDSAAVIEEWHKQRGFSSIGYHYVITKKGIEFGRPVDIKGAHCKGHNEKSIGICVTGRDWFTTKQSDNLKLLVGILKHAFPTINKVTPHNRYDKTKTCPKFKHELFGDYDE